MTPARRSRAVAVAGLVLALAPFAPLAGANADGTTTLTLRLRSAVVIFGHELGVGGTISHDGSPLAGAAVELQLDRYPYRGFVAIASARSSADGAFSFAGVHPSRNARVRVIAVDDPSSTTVTAAVTVDPAVALRSRVLGRGRTLLSATAVHTKAYGSPPVDAYWYVAPQGSVRFQFIDLTKTREAQPGVTTMSATIDPPSRRFRFVVCFVPAWARAMGPPSARLPCRNHDFNVVKPEGPSQ